MGGHLGDLYKGIMEDALWRATPRGVCELVLTELFYNIGGQIPGSLKEVYLTNLVRSTWGKSGTPRHRRRRDRRPNYLAGFEWVL